MTAVGWLALAGALLLFWVPSAASRRADDLAGRRRLVHAGGTGVTRVRRPWRTAQPSTTAVATVGTAVAATVGTVATATVCASAVIAVAVVAGPLLALATGAIAGAGVVLGGDVRRRRTEIVGRRDLLDAVRLLVSELEAGAQPGTALAAAASAGSRWAPEFERAAEQARVGGDAGAVLIAAPDADLRSVGHAFRLGEGSGAPLAEVLSRVASDLAGRAEQRRGAAVALAGPRSSAVLLAGLPVIGIALGAAMGARPVPFLLDTPSGRGVCCAGVLLDVAGLLWTRWIAQRAEPP